MATNKRFHLKHFRILNRLIGSNTKLKINLWTPSIWLLLATNWYWFNAKSITLIAFTELRRATLSFRLLWFRSSFYTKPSPFASALCTRFYISRLYPALPIVTGCINCEKHNRKRFQANSVRSLLSFEIRMWKRYGREFVELFYCMIMLLKDKVER